MKNDKMNFAGIAQALKFQIRSGKAWDDLPSASKEALDQIATSIARTVSGDGVHWDGIIGFAQAAKPGTADVEAAKPGAADVEIGIERLVRTIPRNGQ
jgi:hypothetical protein